MKIVLLILLSLGLSANMFDQMREQFVEQVEVMTETSDLPLSEEKHEVLEGREERLTKNEARKEKELKRMRANADKMHAKIKQKELLKEEVKVGGNTYLDIMMNARTDIPRNSKYRGLDRSWTKRGNTNGVGVISLSGIISEENVSKYHAYIQSQYKFLNKKSFTNVNTATNAYFYTHEGDSIIFSIETTQYKNPTLYKMIIEYTSAQEIEYRQVMQNTKEQMK